MTVNQSLALDYFIAFYPLFLMFLVHVCYCQTLFTQFQIHCSSLDPHIVHSFMLFCKYLFKLNTSLVYSFATILSFLTSIKAQSVSIDLLILTSIYHSHGPQPTKKYPYLAGDVEYFGQEHWPAIWSVCSLYSTDIPSIANVPYPCAFFQRLLNRL